MKKIALVQYEVYHYSENGKCLGTTNKAYLAESMARGRKDLAYMTKAVKKWVRPATEEEIDFFSGTNWLRPRTLC